MSRPHRRSHIHWTRPQVLLHRSAPEKDANVWPAPSCEPWSQKTTATHGERTGGVTTTCSDNSTPCQEASRPCTRVQSGRSPKHCLPGGGAPLPCEQSPLH